MFYDTKVEEGKELNEKKLDDTKAEWTRELGEVAENDIIEKNFDDDKAEDPEELVELGLNDNGENSYCWC